MAKKSLKQLNSMKVLQFNEDLQSYTVVKGYIVMDEDAELAVEYVNFDHDWKRWRIEYTDASDRERVQDSAPLFTVYKQVS